MFSIAGEGLVSDSGSSGSLGQVLTLEVRPEAPRRASPQLPDL